MADEELFIQAIEASPENDGLRLVYSDWLEEHDQGAAANFLRTELELSHLEVDAPGASRLREQLWQCWARVDPVWLQRMTQPRLLRANPTPFPALWVNFPLGDLRKGMSTYDVWPYSSLPAISLNEERGEFRFLCMQPELEGSTPSHERAHSFRSKLAIALNTAQRMNLRLPDDFMRFIQNVDLHSTYRSVTDCFVTTPDEGENPVTLGPCSEAFHFHFYSDSQGCVLWDLYIHPSGAHCVVGREYSYLAPRDDPMDEPGRPPGVWFAAPSFEAFIYRIWMENQVWYIQNQGEAGLITPQIAAYMSHYEAGKEQK